MVHLITIDNPTTDVRFLLQDELSIPRGMDLCRGCYRRAGDRLSVPRDSQPEPKQDEALFEPLLARHLQSDSSEDGLALHGAAW